MKISIRELKRNALIRTCVWIVMIVLFAVYWQPMLIFVHEHGHGLYAVLKGVPYSELVWGTFNNRPSVTVPDTFPIEYLKGFRYAGGFTAGTFTLIIYAALWYVLYRLYFKPKSYKDWSIYLAVFLLSLIFGWVIKELVNGYWEGTQNELYQLGHKYVFITVSFLIASLAHFFALFFAYELKIKRRSPNASS